jgi:hypothetical protein
MMETAPNREPCVIKQQLFDQLIRAHQYVSVLNDQEVGLLFAGDLEATRALEPQQKQARERCAAASEAIREHLAEHLC